MEDMFTMLQKMADSKAGTNADHLLEGHFSESPPHPFTLGLIRAFSEIEPAMPGYAERTIEALADIPARGVNREDFDQILQRLAEVVVVRRLVAWAGAGAQFEEEPTSSTSGKNPEVAVTTAEGTRIAVEVKTPRLTDYSEQRRSYAMSFPTRSLAAPLRAQVEATFGEGLDPRDPPLARFLQSAEDKFSGFKADDPTTVTVLVIVWDDHAHEATSALLHNHVGLLTPNSWDRDENGSAKVYPSVDVVVVTDHQWFASRGIREATRARFPEKAFNWKQPNSFGAVAAPNPAAGDEVELELVCDALEARLPMEGDSQLDAIHWIG